MSGPGLFFEYKHRLVYSLFRAAARVGLRLQVPLDQMSSLLEMAYFEEARERHGFELERIAQVFGKSLRTVSSLHRRYRGDFFAPERELAFRRDVANTLKERPLDDEALAKRFSGREQDLPSALGDLAHEGRILRRGELWVRNPEDHDFFSGAGFTGRIDGLNRQMDILAETVWERLVASAPAERAAARSYVFDASPKKFEKLVADALELLRERAIEADVHVRNGAPGVRRGVTLAASTLEEP